MIAIASCDASGASLASNSAFDPDWREIVAVAGPVTLDQYRLDGTDQAVEPT